MSERDFPYQSQAGDWPLMKEGEGITLFYPYVPSGAIAAISEVLQSRWVGQGPRVDAFEKAFSQKFSPHFRSLAVGSGTDALHIAYLLAGIKQGDEVVAPVFTCTATNLPLLYERATIRFADIDPQTLNISVEHVRRLVNHKTKAIVCVHYGGLPADLKELQAIASDWKIPLIEDAAAALGATYQGVPIGAISDFTIFSFQAIKHITTGDGGMLTIRDPELSAKGERLRWFGIDRTNKQRGTWENDIHDLGYKYQMTDIAAAMGIAGLEDFDVAFAYRQALYRRYVNQLEGAQGIRLLGAGLDDRLHAAWLCTASVDRRMDFMRWLRENNIESGQVHYRNDRYTLFGGRRQDLPNMDKMEDRYIVLPLHMKLKMEDVDKICAVIRKGW